MGTDQGQMIRKQVRGLGEKEKAPGPWRRLIGKLPLGGGRELKQGIAAEFKCPLPRENWNFKSSDHSQQWTLSKGKGSRV